MKKIAIACLNYNRAIGLNNNLIYKIPSDMKYFRHVTESSNITKDKKNVILMGRKTFESLPKMKPLKNRFNLVVSSQSDKLSQKFKYNNLKFFNNIDESLDFCNNKSKYLGDLYVCGGGQIYDYFLKNDLLDEILINKIIEPKIDIGDVFFPNICEKTYNYSLFNEKIIHHDDNCIISNNNKKISTKFINQRFVRYNNFEEQKYLDLLKEVSHVGYERNTRNSITKTRFGVKLDFCLKKSTFPLITTKKVHFKSVVHELLWFLSGKTNIDYLKKNKVNIWNKNTSLNFLRKNNLNYKEGETGPIYGFQWRHFNAKYLGDTTEYKGKGIDQIQNVINLINNDPTSRRIFMSAWNPCQIKEMCLPPCHVSYQFFVSFNEKKEKLLSCMMYQRSGDLFLGIPFNIASTALLTYLIASVTNCTPDKISIVIGDAHIYDNHIDAINRQLKRKSYRFPKIEVNKKSNIDDFVFEDIKLIDYKSHGPIKADMIA